MEQVLKKVELLAKEFLSVDEVAQLLEIKLPAARRFRQKVIDAIKVRQRETDQEPTGIVYFNNRLVNSDWIIQFYYNKTRLEVLVDLLKNYDL